MIKNILKMLNTNDWLVGDEDINIAKGKYEAPLHWKEIKQHIILTKGHLTIKKQTLFSAERVREGYKPVKAINFVAKDFYLLEDLDELTEMGITYEIKYGEGQ